MAEIKKEQYSVFHPTFTEDPELKEKIANLQRSQKDEATILFGDDKESMVKLHEHLTGKGYKSVYYTKIGGGVALNLMELKSKSQPVEGFKGDVNNQISASVSKLVGDLEGSDWITPWESRFGSSGPMYMNIFHPEILESLDEKK